MPPPDVQTLESWEVNKRMAQVILAYCVKEKAKKPMKEAQEVTLSNGKHALKGVCASCGTKMTKFISSKESLAVAVANEEEPGPSEAKSE